LIEKNFHARELTRGQTRFGKFQHCFDLFSFDSGKPIEKIVDGCASFEIFEKCAYGHASFFKNPRSADFFRISLYDGAIVPVEHEDRISQSGLRSKITGST